MRNYNELKISSISSKYLKCLKGKILDIGCNECIFPEKLGLNKKNYFGIDIDDDALKVAKTKGFNVKKVDLDKDNLPFPEKNFDSFICMDILEHLRNPVNVINKIKKVLKSNSQGIISLPNDLNLVNLAKVLLLGRSLLIRNKVWDPHTHLHLPSVSESKKLINKNFKIMHISYRPSNFTVPFLPLNIKIVFASIFPHLFAQNVIFLVKNTKQNAKK